MAPFHSCWLTSKTAPIHMPLNNDGFLRNSWSKTVGVFWHSAAETWIDITNAAANKVSLAHFSHPTHHQLLCLLLPFSCTPYHYLLPHILYPLSSSSNPFPPDLLPTPLLHVILLSLPSFYFLPFLHLLPLPLPLPLRTCWGNYSRTSNRRRRCLRQTHTGCQKVASSTSSSSWGLGRMMCFGSTQL